MTESFSLLCTTRFDPCLEVFEWNNAPDGTPSPYLLLAYQLDRLVSSTHLSHWTVSDSFDYTALKNVCDEAVRKPTTGTLSMKTTNRQAYDDARARVGVPPLGAPRPRNITPNHLDDVILFNPSGAIMESSICNVAFYRHGRWLTPPLTVGCIPGVFRRWLLENGRIHEADGLSISLDTIENNEWVLVFNGVTGVSARASALR
ncbi:putative aminodeoxychorismate lyase [Butyriboletus roseoflavus]|nr:putative aminodeoxychorismate lyase [Butyriboletus roseoflavus]